MCCTDTCTLYIHIVQTLSMECFLRCRYTANNKLHEVYQVALRSNVLQLRKQAGSVFIILYIKFYLYIAWRVFVECWSSGKKRKEKRSKEVTLCIKKLLHVL